MRFFVDACVSTRLVKALKEVASGQRYAIVALEDKFEPDTPDPTWLRVLGREGGWTIVSGDPRISRSPAEQAAWAEAGLTIFFLGDEFSSCNPWVQAARLFQAWPNIVSAARDEPAGTAHMVSRKGALRRIDIPQRRNR